MSFAKKYRIHFFVACITSISLAIVAAIRPYLIIETVDNYITGKDPEGLHLYTLFI